MVIYDSVEKKKVEFIPIQENEVKIYVCGPTVYDDAHLGHARSAIAFDLLRRVFMAMDYHVTFVKNFTDIDDKIIHKMKEHKAINMFEFLKKKKTCLSALKEDALALPLINAKNYIEKHYGAY